MAIYYDVDETLIVHFHVWEVLLLLLVEILLKESVKMYLVRVLVAVVLNEDLSQCVDGDRGDIILTEACCAALV